MRVKYYLIGFITILLFSHCEKDLTSPECILPLEEMVKAMNECRDGVIPEASNISNNLVGEWKLVGYGCGFCVPHTPPEAYMILNETKGILMLKDDFDGDTLVTFNWRLEQITNTLEEKATYRFKTEPFHYALNMDIFCEEFMFFDERPFDGSLFLYQKQ